ncbi:dienelactone hydrolase family protein [Melissospora conviva]|uniref:dienelactone hydrolase family protein n=1 Tax=Melissospora conviva TaxID=3388432 RepID=UPI003B8030B9
MQAQRRETMIPSAGTQLPADLSVPPGSSEVVLFAHGSGSSRRSPRNTEVARQLNEAALATVLVDLLTGDEDEPEAIHGDLRFDISLLTDRLIDIVDWVRADPQLGKLPIGLFGASTGAAAALSAAAARPDAVRAVVSRGGRPDLAGPALADVQAPTLLLVGGRDEQVRELNERALDALPPSAQLRVVPGATHLFEEPGALTQVADQAKSWFAANR